MTKHLVVGLLIFLLTSCSNSPELETGEIKVFQILKDAVNQNKNLTGFVDSRTLLSREQVDLFGNPVLFVELSTGQNGTLTRYPGKEIGQTWLGADGATINLNRGVLKATRGMGNDIMGGISSMPSWGDISANEKYIRKISYLSGNNGLFTRNLKCQIKENAGFENVEIWNLSFKVKKFNEICSDHHGVINNIYYLDSRQIVRKSLQYHSDTLGYITIERLDR